MIKAQFCLDVDHCDVDDVNKKEGTQCIHNVESMLVNICTSTMSSMKHNFKKYEVVAMSTRC